VHFLKISQGMHDLPPIGNFHLTDHALFEMTRRQLTEEHVIQVLSAPEQTEGESGVPIL
jgi:hypothetical protein